VDVVGSFFYSIVCKRRFASPNKQTAGLQGWQTVTE
jgi:hypothetical protein